MALSLVVRPSAALVARGARVWLSRGSRGALVWRSFSCRSRGSLGSRVARGSCRSWFSALTQQRARMARVVPLVFVRGSWSALVFSVRSRGSCGALVARGCSFVLALGSWRSRVRSCRSRLSRGSHPALVVPLSARAKNGNKRRPFWSALVARFLERLKQNPVAKFDCKSHIVESINRVEIFAIVLVDLFQVCRKHPLLVECDWIEFNPVAFFFCRFDKLKQCVGCVDRPVAKCAHCLGKRAGCQ